MHAGWPHRKLSPDALAALIAQQRPGRIVRSRSWGENAFSSVSWSLCPLLFYSPIPAQGHEDRGRRVGSPGSSFTQSFFHREGGVGLRSKSFHFCPVLSCTSCESQWRCHFFPTSTSLWLLSFFLLTQSGLGNPPSVTWASKQKYDPTQHSREELRNLGLAVQLRVFGCGPSHWGHQEHSPCLHVELMSAVTDTKSAVSGT